MLTLRLSKTLYRLNNAPLKLLVLAISVAFLVVTGYGQDNPGEGPAPPYVDLLKLSGSKPNLAANGDGIVSYQTSSLFKRGVTQVKPFDLDLKIELPTGYSLFNNLAYVVDTQAVFSGPNDVVFSVPSATAKGLFDRLRILYAEYDRAAPDKPRWVDVTMTGASDNSRYLTKAELEKRLPDFDRRTLHALLDESALTFVVAVKDSALARDNFRADLTVSATASPQSVMEGRTIKQVFVVTNNGPDTATSISFSSYVEPELISLSQSQGVCRWEAHNIYCNLGTLPKGASATITHDGRCRWGFFYDGKPMQSGGQDATPVVMAAERDPNYENNQTLLSVDVIEDPNKAPLVDVVSPTEDQFFVGPNASIKIDVTAHDPDGTIEKLELLDAGQPIGVGKRTAKDKYEFVYENVSFGHHWITAVATDNKGRPGGSGNVNVHVNGQARIKILSPSANQVINGPVNGLEVRVRVSHPSKAIKKVVIHNGLYLGGMKQTGAPGPGADEYSTSFKDISSGGTYTLYVVATDDADVETLSEPISFRVTDPPLVDLHYFDGEYARDLTDGIVLSVAAPIELITKVGRIYDERTTSIVKVEFYAGERLICSDVNEERKESSFYNFRDFRCLWQAKPGKYVLTAVATDSDGVAGKSKPAEVVIR
jgi:hypothetical protein